MLAQIFAVFVVFFAVIAFLHCLILFPAEMHLNRILIPVRERLFVPVRTTAQPFRVICRRHQHLLAPVSTLAALDRETVIIGHHPHPPGCSADFAREVLVFPITNVERHIFSPFSMILGGTTGQDGCDLA